MLMRKLIVANWKSHKSPAEAMEWVQAAQHTFGHIPTDSITAVVAPAFPLLPTIADSIKTLNWKLAAQDVSPFSAGSYTGAVSAHNFSHLGVEYVLVGHSERRRYFSETPHVVSQKIDQAIENKLTPLVCIDESSLAAQAAVISSRAAGQCIVVYEPSEAIGTGNNASLEDVKKFRREAEQVFGSVPFLYGGSVDELNIGEYLLVTDGVLIGTASLDISQFIRVLEAALGKPPSGL